MGLEQKLVSTKYVKLVRDAFNWYAILEEYLEIMPLTKEERSSIKLSITVKIERVVDTKNKKLHKDMKRRMKKMKNDVLEREKLQNKKYVESEHDMLVNLGNQIFRRDALNGDL